MVTYLSLGSVPCDEDCAQLGTPNYCQRAQRECTLYIEQLRRLFGPEPTGARLCIKACRHDFGVYYEVHVRYDDSIEKAVRYAFRIEDNLPLYWDCIVERELKHNLKSARSK